tara:strand:- start:3056 stop:5410 length:2355 start_codon:yes stop_codon:yes gene_type:complete
VAYSAEIDVKVRNLGSISKLEEKLSSINRSINGINRVSRAGRSGGGAVSDSNKVRIQKEVNKAKKVELDIEREIARTQAIRVRKFAASMNTAIEKNARLLDIQAAADRNRRSLPSASMLDADKRGIQRVPTASQLGTKPIALPGGAIDTARITTSAEKAAIFENRIAKARARSDAVNNKLLGSEKQRNRQAISVNRAIDKQNKLSRTQANNLRKLGDSFGKLGQNVGKFQEGLTMTRGTGGKMLALPSSQMLDARVRGSGQTGGFARSIPTGLGRAFAGFDRGSALSSAAISGAFPLLFGQGPLTAAGGAIGGGLGGGFGGQMGGFAGGLIGTAAVSGVVGLANSSRDLAKAVTTTSGTLDLMRKRSLFSSEAVEAQALSLQKQGKRTELATLLTNELNKALGAGGIEQLKDLAENSRESARQFGILKTQMDLFIAGPLSKLLEIMNKVVGKANVVNQLNQTLKKLEETSPGAVRGIMTDLRAEGSVAQKAGSVAGSIINPSNLKVRGTSVGGLSTDQLSRFLKIANSQLPKSTETIGGSPLDTVGLSGKSLDDKLAKIKKETEFRNNIINLGREEAEVQRQINELREGLNETDLKKIETGEINLRQIVESSRQTEKLADNALKVQEAFAQISITIGQDIKEGIKGLIKGTSTLSDLLNNVADRFLDVALNQALFGDILGSKGDKGGGLLGFLGFANGGRPPVGRPSIVGEKGPELFVPSRSGTIIPNNKLGGGSTNNVVVNVDASGSDVQGDEAEAKELGTLISVAVQGELLKQQRPGGLLSR